MIPKFTVRKEFYNELLDKLEETIENFKRFEEPYDEFKNYGIAVYPKNAELHLSKDGNGQFNEKYYAMLDDWGYCPSENALVQFLHNRGIVSSNTPYMVTAHLVKTEVAAEDETYSYYVTEDGEESDMTVCDYIDEYGKPTTQYEGYLIKFRIFILNE
jgi:hypothetical protein